MYEKCKNISVPTSIAAQVKNLQVRIRYVQFSHQNTKVYMEIKYIEEFFFAWALR